MVEEGFELTGHPHNITRGIKDHQICFFNRRDHRLHNPRMGTVALAFDKAIATTDTGGRGVPGHEKLGYFGVLTGQFVQEKFGDIKGATFVKLSMDNRNLHPLSSP